MRKRTVSWPARRTLFHVKASSFGRAFWVAVVLVAVAAAVVLALWQAPSA